MIKQKKLTNLAYGRGAVRVDGNIGIPFEVASKKTSITYIE